MVYPSRRSRSTISSKEVAQLWLQRPKSSTPCEVSVAGSLLPSAPIEHGARFQGAARSPQWRRRETAVIERCDRSTQYTCFTPSSMHLRRTNTAMFPVLEHDRSACSTVVQSTTMSTVFQHRRAHAMPRAHVGPRCRAWCSAAPSQPSFIVRVPSRPKCSESAASVASCSSRREAVVAPRWPPFFARQQGRPAPVPPFPRGILAVS